MKIIERNVQEIGKSLLVTLPKPWADSLNIHKGSVIKMLVSDRGDLSIAPEFVKKDVQKEVSIAYDSHFERRFFKEYFYGFEKIVINFEKEFNESNRKNLYLYIKRFMNVQIVEETKTRIVVKCFKIDELTIEECLNRIYFLSLTLFDELQGKKDEVKLAGIRDTMTRFYYMLVMQIRRYLSEGKFTSENQIPLIRAMDFRMVAEKIQRIGEILLSMDEIKDNGHKALLIQTKKYYSTTFGCFINSDFSGALPLWNEGNSYQKKYSHQKEIYRRKKDLYNYKITSEIQSIVRYIKEISMLVR